MDLRERAGLPQRWAEGVIRFRLVFLSVFLVAWWFLATSWKASVAYFLLQAKANADVLSQALQGTFPTLFSFLQVLLLLLLLVMVRARMMSWKAGLSTLWFVVAVLGVCWMMDDTARILPAILGAVLFTLVTLFVFGKSAWFICSLAFSISIYLLASWIPGVAHGKGLGWQLLIALASADLAVQIAVIRSQMKAGYPKAGSVVKAILAVWKGVLASAAVFLVVDGVCISMGQTTLFSGSLLDSLLSCLGYLLVVLAFAPALFSLSPLGRMEAKKKGYHMDGAKN